MLAAVLALSISHPARALDIDRSMQGDWIVVSAVMAHPPDRINAVLAKHGETMRLGRGVRSVEVVPAQDGCAHLTVRNRGFARDLSYTAERCPVEYGGTENEERGLRGPSSDLDDGAGRAGESGHHSGQSAALRAGTCFVRQVVGGALEDTLEKMMSSACGVNGLVRAVEIATIDPRRKPCTVLSF